MKNIFLLFVLFNMSLSLSGQAIQQIKSETEPLKIVIQVTSDDTLVHKSVIRQLGNITSVDSTLKIEVVCHGPGIEFIHKEKTLLGDKIKMFTEKGVVFNGCEFTLKERKIEKSKILETANFVQSALLHIAKRQQMGWSYVKAGF
jgi:intracellular sulfur oxidation DsrE/DsrF family protein